MEDQTKQKMTYESRIALVAKNFSAKMSTLYQPHVRLRDNDSGGIYLQEIAEAINSRLPSEIPNDEVYTSALREVWQGVVAKHKSNYWFNLSDCISATNKVASKYNAMYRKQKAAFSGTIEAERQSKEAEPKKPETIEGWLKNLKMTDDLIKSGDLARPMGMRLRGIPCAALARLGYEGDTSLEGLPETPAEHLPNAPPECNAHSTTSEAVSNVTQASQEPDIAKPLMQQSESELNMRLIKAGMTKPEPIDKPEFDAVIEAGGDDLPDWGSGKESQTPSFDSL